VPSLIAVGGCLFVFQGDVRRMLSPPVNRYGMAGTFHLEAIIDDLYDAAVSKRDILLAGPSGSGKELAAQAVATIMGGADTPIPVVTCNAARFSSEEQAVTALFGVGKNVFSSVDPSPGLIEQSDKGILFLDEVHNLSEHVQRSLLRVIENRELSRVGREADIRAVSVRFILSSNMSSPLFGLAHDLLARLRLVELPALHERFADIPTIFDYFLGAASRNHRLEKRVIDEIVEALDVDHYEMMCLDGFRVDNFRGVIDLSERIVSKVANGVSPVEAVDMVFEYRFVGSPVLKRMSEYAPEAAASFSKSPLTLETTLDKGQIYRQNRRLIIDVYLNQAKKRIATTVRILKHDYKIKTTRHSLARYLQKWGVSC
jgi:DNA-binding NtrC family response regulator